MKQAIMKPWHRRSQRKARRRENQSPPPPSSLEGSNFRPLQFGQFSPFAAGPHGRQRINPLSGGGNPFLFHQLTGGGGFPNYHPAPGPFSDSPPLEENSKEEVPNGVFEPPPPKPSRPALSNIFPMYDSPKVSKTPAQQQNKPPRTMPVKPAQPSKPMFHGRRNSTPAERAKPEHILNRRPSCTSGQSTTSDITYERKGKKERRASAIRALPLLPTGEQQRQPAVAQGKEWDYDFTNEEAPSHSMYQNPSSSANKVENGLLGPAGAMYGWSQQPHEQLQKLEEELEEEGPEGEEEDMGIESWEREGLESSPAKLKGYGKPNLKSSKVAPRGEPVDDFAREFVRQLTLGEGQDDVLY